MSTLRWIAAAQPVTDVWTLSLSGTVTSQTYTITIGSATLSYTSTGGDTATTIFAAIYALWVSTANPVPPEFKELTPSKVGATLVLTGTKTGVPHTVAFATGGAATCTATNTTAATGPNFVDNTANYSTGAIPTNSDTVVFDSGSVSAKYGFSTLAALTGVTVQVNPGYSGNIGLPDRNTDAGSYHEYRTSSFTLDGGTLIVNSPNISLCRFNFSSTLAVVRVLNTGRRLDPNTPVVLLTGGAASSELDVSKGDVGVAFFAGESATFPTVRMGFVSQKASDAQLVVGVGGSVTTITKSGGNLDLYHSATTLTQDTQSGVTTLNGAVALTTLNVNGGTVNMNTVGTIATINVRNDGVLTCDGDPRAKTVTNAINVYGPTAYVIDNEKTVNSGVLTVATTGVPTGNIQHGLTNSSIVLT